MIACTYFSTCLQPPGCAECHMPSLPQGAVAWLLMLVPWVLIQCLLFTVFADFKGGDTISSLLCFHVDSFLLS